MKNTLCNKIITKKYCKKTDNDYLLFKALLERMPKQILATNSKNDFAKVQKFNIRTKNNIALLNYKWLLYNEDRVWHLNFDIDKKFSFEEIINFLNERFDLTPTWLAYTDRGLQFGFMLINVLKSKKQIDLAKEAKKIITNELIEYFVGDFEKNKDENIIDTTASNKIRGFWRNPLMHEYAYTGHFIELKTLKLKVLIPNTPKPEIKKPINKSSSNSVKNNKFPYPQISYNDTDTIRIDFPDGKYKIVKLANKIMLLEAYNKIHQGIRNKSIFLNLLANTNSKDFDEVYAIAQYLNNLSDVSLDEKELKKITRSVLKYNRTETNTLYEKFMQKHTKERIISVRTCHKNWEIGKMGFKKIEGLNYDEYKEEVRKRQKKAGKEIGSKNLKKYNEQKMNETKEKVYNAIKLLQNKGEKISVRKIMQEAKVSKNSASKYIKQARENGII